MIEEYSKSEDPELIAKASKMIEAEKTYNSLKGIKRRKTITMVKKKYSRKTLDLRQAIQPSPAIISVSSQRVTRSSNVLSK